MMNSKKLNNIKRAIINKSCLLMECLNYATITEVERIDEDIDKLFKKYVEQRIKEEKKDGK